MRIERWEARSAKIEFSIDELDLLRNGLNEALLAVKGEADFETRLAGTRDEATALIKALQRLLTDMAHAEEQLQAKTKIS
jgi:hypothetical protein